MKAPQRVAVYMLGDNLVAVESFIDEPAEVELALQGVVRAEVELALPDASNVQLSGEAGALKLVMPPRSMVLLRTKCPE